MCYDYEAMMAKLCTESYTLTSIVDTDRGQHIVSIAYDWKAGQNLSGFLIS
jgi:hypothetical protein